VMLIQGNHEGREKWGMEITDILEDYMQIIEEYIDDEISLVIMPETALPYAIEEHVETKNRLLRICREYGVELLVGGIEKAGETSCGADEEYIDDSKRAGDRKSYNAVYHVTSEGIRRPAYRKRILVPFGEYLPFAPLVERVCPWLMEFMTGNVFEAGYEEIIFDTNIGRIGTLICFESLFSKAARETVEEGAQILAIVSNDAWFEGTPAMRQHHAHAIIRAVETDRYILRVGNTGISSLIDNRGRIQVTMPENTRGALKADAALCMEESVYSEVGDVLPIFFSVLFAFVIIKKAGVLIFSHLSAIIKR
ncbi:MAG: apolipoprotein N-acyltransferase, partial [Lachnospiraceae bacterium]|nr:apolipoprotein N-acyltransferase [Lachnospiraceae bacterium]